MTPVLDYHQNTKHSFHRFARSLGYLDWAAQPDPFRRFAGAPLLELPRQVLRPAVPYGALFDGSARPAPLDDAAIGEFLRCSLGLSAWKQHQRSRWALRVNPSSGNLHPTEAYVVWNRQIGHYAPREHAIEVRASGLDTRAALPDDTFLVGLTSILWREAWKYGERAFRYCQHDVGHALGALRCAGALLGWQVRLLQDCPEPQIAALLGLDRDGDFADAEREEAECVAVVTSRIEEAAIDLPALAEAARTAVWSGRANVLSRGRVAWPAIDDVAAATRASSGRRDSCGHAEAGGAQPGATPWPGDLRRADGVDPVEPAHGGVPGPGDARWSGAPPSGAALSAAGDRPALSARAILLQRRSALGFDAHSSLPRDRFLTMLRRLDPPAPPWDVIDWRPQVHLVLFVHRVEGLVPGLYVYLRDPAAHAELRAALRPDFLWEPPEKLSAEQDRLFLLVPTDVRFAANRLSCDQDIASDGFFAMAMLARLEPALREHGDGFYRQLFWECGLVGQVLYLEAEAAGARATGIGCFYDDPVHEMLGLSGMAWQSLYHFSMGVPVDDGRLTTDPGYPGGW